MHIKTKPTIALSHFEFMHCQRQFSSEFPFKNSCLKSSNSLHTSTLSLCTAGLMKYFLVCRISQQIFDTFGLPTRQCWTVTQLVNDSLGHFLFASLKVLMNKQSKRQASKHYFKGFFTLFISSSVWTVTLLQALVSASLSAAWIVLRLGFYFIYLVPVGYLKIGLWSVCLWSAIGDLVTTIIFCSGKGNANSNLVFKPFGVLALRYFYTSSLSFLLSKFSQAN